MEKKELIGVEELNASLQKVFDEIEYIADIYNVKVAVKETLKLLQITQQKPVIIRSAIWECNFHVINFLRKNKQMLQSNFSFDDDVLSCITDALKNTMVRWFRKH